MLRDRYYESLSERKVNIRLPDIQSFFLFSLTLGINYFAIALRKPGDIYDPQPFSLSDVLNWRFPIGGPEWVCSAANREMPYVADVFCDFQDEILKPMGESRA